MWDLYFGTPKWDHSAYAKSYSVEKFVTFQASEDWNAKLGFHKPSQFGDPGTIESKGIISASLKSDGSVFIRTSYPILIGQPSAPLVDVAKAQNVQLMFAYKTGDAEKFTPLAYASSSVASNNGQLYADLKDEAAKALRDAIATGEPIVIGLFAGQNYVASSDAITNEGYDEGLKNAKAAFAANQEDIANGVCQ